MDTGRPVVHFSWFILSTEVSRESKDNKKSEKQKQQLSLSAFWAKRSRAATSVLSSSIVPLATNDCSRYEMSVNATAGTLKEVESF